MPDSQNTATYDGHRWLEANIRPDVEPSVMSAFRVSRPHGFMHGPQIHYLWVLEYYHTPGIRYRTGTAGRWQPRETFVAHLHRPNVPYSDDSTALPGPVSSCYLSFRGGDQLRFGDLVPASVASARFIDPDHRVRDLMLEIISVGRTEGYDGFCKAQSGLYRLLHLLYTATPVKRGEYAIAPPDHGHREPTLSAVVQNFLQNHLADDLCLQDLARHAKVSVSVVAHRYKQEVGESPMRTLMRLRIERGKDLLLRGLQVKQAADSVGFYDQYHFSRQFKQMEGVSPLMFLRKVYAMTERGAKGSAR